MAGRPTHPTTGLLIESCESSLNRVLPARSSRDAELVTMRRSGLERVWAGVDVGKHHHHCVVVDQQGDKRSSRRVANDESALLELIGEVAARAGDTTWAIDLHGSESALLVTLLLAHDQQIVYPPGVMVNQATRSYRGAGKTDAKDAYVIADQARMRRDLTVLHAEEELIVELRMLVTQRQDLVGDRTRAANRLHDRLLAVSLAMQGALTLGNRGPLMLLTKYQTPAAVREAGIDQIIAWLRKHGVRSAAALAAAVVHAADTQHTTLPGESLAAQLVARSAEGVLALDAQIKELSAIWLCDLPA
ncbi:IS110 family transposase [Nocardia sp. NPDC004711]